MTARSPWLRVLPLWGGFLLAYVSRQAIFSAFPVLRSELGFSEVQLGLTGTVFLWAYALGSPFAGRMADRFPKGKVAAWSVLAWSLVTASMGAASGPMSLLMARGLLAVTQCFYVPAALSLIAQWHGEATRSRAISLYATGQYAGAVAGGWLGGWLTERMGWRWMFRIIAAAGVAYAPALGALAGRDEPAEAAAARPAGVHGGVTAPAFLVICVAMFASTAALWLVYTWLPDVLRGKFNLSLGSAGWLATAYVQGAIVAGLAAGSVAGDRLITRTRRGRLYVMALGLCGYAPAVWGIARAATLTGVKLAAVAYGFFKGLFTANYVAAAFDGLPKESRGFAMGLLNLIGGLSGGLAAYLFGLLRARIALERLFGAAGALGAVAGLAVLWLASKTPEERCSASHATS